MEVVSSVSSWLPVGERESMRPLIQVSASLAASPPHTSSAQSSPGLERVIFIGNPNVPQDDPLVIGGR